jgi:hypothetical protein
VGEGACVGIGLVHARERRHHLAGAGVWAAPPAPRGRRRPAAGDGALDAPPGSPAAAPRRGERALQAGPEGQVTPALALARAARGAAAPGRPRAPAGPRLCGSGGFSPAPAASASTTSAVDAWSLIFGWVCDPTAAARGAYGGVMNVGGCPTYRVGTWAGREGAVGAV